MTADPEFALVPLARLRAHERIEEENVGDLIEEIRTTGVFSDPIWVARGSDVILNGHHRVEAARRLGAVLIPAWVLDYESDLVAVEPWRPGLPITKQEVVARARSGDLFPPKTTRHRLRGELPPRATLLTELLPPAAPESRERADGSSRAAPPVPRRSAPRPRRTASAGSSARRGARRRPAQRSRPARRGSSRAPSRRGR